MRNTNFLRYMYVAIEWCALYRISITPLLFHDESVIVHIKCIGGGGGVGLICMLLI